MNLRRTAAVCLLTLAPMLASSATAQTYTRAQVEVMTEAQREASSYLGVIRALEPDRLKTFRFFVQRGLAEMGYGNFSLEDAPDDQLRAAVSAFQRRIAAPVTGDITVGQYDRLSTAVRMFHKSKINLGWKRVTESQGYLVVEGTWTIQSEEHAFPFNKSKIECWRERRICTEAASYVSEGLGLTTLGVHTNHYDILKWSGEEVQIEISHLCVTNTVFINIRTEYVTMIRRPKSACPTGEARLENKVFVLSEGSQYSLELERKRFEAAVVEVMNPDLWRRYMNLSR